MHTTDVIVNPTPDSGNGKAPGLTRRELLKVAPALAGLPLLAYLPESPPPNWQNLPSRAALKSYVTYITPQLDRPPATVERLAELIDALAVHLAALQAEPELVGAARLQLAEVGLFEATMLANFRLADDSLRDYMIETYLGGVPEMPLDEAVMEFAKIVFVLRDTVVAILEDKPVDTIGL